MSRSIRISLFAIIALVIGLSGSAGSPTADTTAQTSASLDPSSSDITDGLQMAAAESCMDPDDDFLDAESDLESDSDSTTTGESDLGAVDAQRQTVTDLAPAPESEPHHSKSDRDDDIYEAERRLVLGPGQYAADLLDHITTLSHLTHQRNQDAQQRGQPVPPPIAASTPDLFRLYDRLRALPVAESRIRDGLQRCDFLSASDRTLLGQLDDAYRRRRRDKKRFGPVGADMVRRSAILLDVVQDQYGIDLGNGWLATRRLINLICASNQSHLLWDIDFLRLLLVQGDCRLSLVDVLQACDVPDAALEAALPLYLAYWPANDDVRVNWDFFDAMQTLTPGKLQQVWGLEAVRGQYRDRIGDLIPGLVTYDRFALLEKIKFPYLKELFEGPDLYRAMGRAQPYETLTQLLVAAPFAPFRAAIVRGLQAQPADGVSFYPRWRDLPALSADPTLINQLLGSVPDDEWRQTALRIVAAAQASPTPDGPLKAVVHSAYLQRLLESIGIAYDQRSSRKAVTIVDDGPFQQLLIDQLAVGDGARGRPDLSAVVTQAYWQNRDALRTLCNAQDRHGNTLAHYAFANRDAAMLTVLLALPGVELAPTNDGDWTPFDFVTTWPHWDRRTDFYLFVDDAIDCIEVIARHADRLKASWVAPRRPSRAQFDASSSSAGNGAIGSAIASLVIPLLTLI